MRLDGTIKTLTVETRDDEEGLWLCVDTGKQSTPIARFISYEAVTAFIEANSLSFRKAYAMGKMGI